MSEPNLSSSIWSVADLLRGDYKQSEYGRVILPFTVLRRLDCVLERTKPAVLAEFAARKKAGINPEPFLLKKVCFTTAPRRRASRPFARVPCRPCRAAFDADFAAGEPTRPPHGPELSERVAHERAVMLTVASGNLSDAEAQRIALRRHLPEPVERLGVDLAQLHLGTTQHVRPGRVRGRPPGFQSRSPRR